MVTSSPFPKVGVWHGSQWTTKWWLGLPLTPERVVCAYCPDKALDAHHAVTCKFVGDVVARHNTLCKRYMYIWFLHKNFVEPKTCAGLGHERRLTRPADILIPSWSLVISLQPLMFWSLLRLYQVFCPKRVWLQVQLQVERQQRENIHAMIAFAPIEAGTVFH